MPKLVAIFLFILFGIVACNKEDQKDKNPVETEDHHPFLIVKKERYQNLREKADQEPWASIKEDALERAENGSKASAYDLQYYIGAAALAYILDEDNAQLHAHRVRDAILDQYSKLELYDGGDWGGVVPPMGSFFVAILSLDIVYDALTIEEILACEHVIENQIFKISRDGSWADARRGTHGTWDIYKGVRTTPDDIYYEGIMHQITEDGVSPVTNHYAWERVGGGNSRISKSGYMDVLEFTGIDQRYYNNERLQKFQRWLFGSSANCAKEMAIFGDMLPTQGISNDMLHRRVVNFDMEAASYAAWFHYGTPAIGNILTYILPKSALPEPVIPNSKIYENGGAFFREQENNPNGLHAVLYNIKSQDEWHTHNEVNGLALSGLGNRLLVNGGRLGEPTRAAYLNNTLTINGANHNSRLGGGIVEGFTATGLDYASGFSGPVFTNTTHYRNLVLVHGSENANAYFVVIDEVQANSGENVRNYLHPANQTTVSSIASGLEYEASIDHYPTVNGVKLTLFYATAPSQVNVEKVQSAVPDRYPGYPEHNRLEAIYDTDGAGAVNIVTALFPHNASITKPAILRIAENEISGCSFDHGKNTRDIILESSDDQDHQYDNITFRGKAMIARSTNSTPVFYFMRHGTFFDHGGIGFSADAPVCLYIKDKQGVIVSNGAVVTFKGPGMDQISFNPGATVIDFGENFIKIKLPAGEVRF